MENWVYFSALAIAFGLGFAVCAAVFADRIGGRTPSASHNSASTPCPKCKGVGFYVDRAFERINCDKCS